VQRREDLNLWSQLWNSRQPWPSQLPDAAIHVAAAVALQVRFLVEPAPHRPVLEPIQLVLLADEVLPRSRSIGALHESRDRPYRDGIRQFHQAQPGSGIF
jgi:hypothetical protein